MTTAYTTDLRESLENTGTQHIELEPNETYEVSEEIVVPQNVTIEGNGATLEAQGDHNVLFLEDDVHLSHLWVSVRNVEGYSSKAITIDTERYGDSYHGSAGGIFLDGVYVTGSGDNMSGDGIHINVGEKQWYSANQFHKIGVSGMGNGLHADVGDSSGGGHANANRFHALLWNNGTQIRHSGGGPFESVIIGELDASSNGAGTEHMIVNENSTQRTCHFEGKIYDPFNCSGEPLVGNVNLKHHGRPHPYLLDESPNAGGLLVSQDRDEIFYADLNGQNNYRQRFVGDWWRFQFDPEGGRDFSDAFSIRAEDRQVRFNQELVANDMWVTGKMTHDLNMGNKKLKNHAEGQPEGEVMDGADGFLEIQVDGESRYVPYFQ